MKTIGNRITNIGWDLVTFGAPTFTVDDEMSYTWWQMVMEIIGDRLVYLGAAIASDQEALSWYANESVISRTA